MKDKIIFGHKGSGKTEIEKIIILENLFDNLPPSNSDGKYFIVGCSGAGKAFRMPLEFNIKHVSNNWRKMHHKPMLRKRNGMSRERYLKEQLSWLL